MLNFNKQFTVGYSIIGLRIIQVSNNYLNF